MDAEEGITYPRLRSLVALDERERGREMQELAVAVNAAMAKDPKKAVARLGAERRRPLTNEDVPSYLRIPKKRQRGEVHGA